MPRERNVHTFIGCDSTYEESQLVIYGAPFDSTTSFRPGTRFASAAMRNESFGIETFSPYQELDLEDFAVFDAGDLELPFGSPARALEQLEQEAELILSDGKIPLMIGGEHLVTLAPVRAAAKRYKDLCIIHFDAHADLRENYLGEELSHASVIRRCHDILGDGRIFQFGIRSGERAEFAFAASHTTMNRFNLNGLDEAIRVIGDRPVSFTLDLDVLDPSEFPGTGTPEAGGVRFTELLDAIIRVSRTNIIGLDINELSPHYDQSGASTALACKLLRETILAVLNNRKKAN